MLRLLSLPVLCCLLSFATAEDRPNILIIMADDCTHNDLPVYGGRNAMTPNIDRLAQQSLVFDRAYLAEAMCQPCRAELYSGQFPLRNGCAWNHSASRPSTRSMPMYLGELGYRVGIAGKVHVKPADAYPFEKVKGFDASCVRNPTNPHQLDDVGQFMSREPGEPFCLVIALVEPHVPWVMGDASAYPPKEIEIPDNLADTERTRIDYANYLAEITYMDGQVGEILESLELSGEADNTLVLFTSEQGSQFPGNKWTTWDTGLHSGFMARWPGRIEAGKRTSALIHYADVLPTLIELAGGDPSDGTFDGKSFKQVLLGQADEHREYTYGIHNNLPEGPAYPTRSVFNGEFRYIRNYKPEDLYIEKHLMGMQGGGGLNNPYWVTWVGESWNNERTYTLVKRYMSRPAEELYRTSNDPYELSNIADDEQYAEVLQSLRDELDRWMESQGDPGADQDTQEALQAARQGKHLYFPPGN